VKDNQVKDKPVRAIRGDGDETDPKVGRERWEESDAWYTYHSGYTVWQAHGKFH
jgi:hypothetical protein